MAGKYDVGYLERALSPKRFSAYSHGDIHSFYVKYAGKISVLTSKIKKCGLDVRMEASDIISVFSKDGPGLDLMRAYHQRNFIKEKSHY